MATTPQPETPANPSITIETGRQYEPGDITLLTPEVAAKYTSPEDGAVMRLIGSAPTNHTGHELTYGISWRAHGVIVAYPIKPGTYPTNVHVGYYRPAADEDSEETLIEYQTTVVDLVVTGQELGTYFEREVLHHVHPPEAAMSGLSTRVTAVETAATTAQTAADTAQARADAAHKRADTALANAESNKEANDSQGNAIGVLRGRVTTAEGKILAIEESIANSRDD